MTNPHGRFIWYELMSPDLVIQGSSTLYPQLLTAGLLDRLPLMTFPVVLGHGKRLFGEGTPRERERQERMKLEDAAR